jgi:transposase-like protein
MACVQCPRCGDSSVAVSERSDGIDSYRCDRCSHTWSVPSRPDAEKDDELPPLPAIDAPGG